MQETIAVRIPKAELELWHKARADRSWREIMESGLFGDHKPTDVMTYDEVVALIDQKIAEALAKK